MKEQILLQMKNKIETLGSIVQTLMIEVDHLKTLSFGSSKIIKAMPGYDDAIEKLKQDSKTEEKVDGNVE
jgi:hypothetical protein